MNATEPNPITSDSRNPEAAPYIATRAHQPMLPRKLAFAAGVIAAPIAIGAGVARLTGSRRAGWIAGGATAALAVAVRWQLQRWFTAEPAYVIEQRIGDLEIRRYAPRVEARTRLDDSDFDRALEEGFGRLAGYIFGGNTHEARLAMTTPVLASQPVGVHVVSFVMPPGTPLVELPVPRDPRVELVDLPAQRIAVLRYRGAYDAATVEAQSRQLRELVSAANLSARGEPTMAGFDPPSTLPRLRRSEIWIELI